MFVSLQLSAQTNLKAFDVNTGKTVVFSIYKSEKQYLGTDSMFQLNFKNPQNLTLKSTGYFDKWLTVRPNKSIYDIAFIPLVQNLNEVVITDAFLNKDIKNTVLNVTKISQEQIRLLGANDLRDALNFQNNIVLRRDNAIGITGLSLMGISGDNVKILRDGIPVIGRFFGQLDLEQFNLQNTEQIELIQGPMSVIYGSNALAGSINIISKTDKGSGVSLLSNYESDGRYNWSGTGYFSNRKSNYSLSIGRMFFDGWSQNKIDRSYEWIPKEQYTGDYTYLLNLKKTRLTWRTSVLQTRLLDKGSPTAPYGETAIDQKFKNQRLDNSMAIDRNFKGGRLNLTIGNNYFYRTKNKYLKDLISLNETLIPINEEQDTQSFNASLIRAVFSKTNIEGINVLAGLDANHEIGKGKRIENGLKEQTDAALFFSIDKTFSDRLTIRYGSRYAYNSAYETPHVYSWQTRYNFPGSQSIKLAYGKGFRAPSLKELYFSFFDSNHAIEGNDSLSAETSNSFTGSYIKYFGTEKTRLRFELDGFYNSINNKIDLIVKNVTEAKYGNIGLFQSVGANAGFSMENTRFGGSLMYSYTGTYNGIDTSKRDFVFAPQLVVKPYYVFQKWGTRFTMFANHYGQISRVFEDENGNQSVRSQQSYTLIDFTISQAFFKKTFNTTFGIRNMLNTINLTNTLIETGVHRSSSSSFAISPGRTFFISLQYEFIKK